MRGKVDESVLIQAGASGVGIAAIQLAALVFFGLLPFSVRRLRLMAYGLAAAIMVGGVFTGAGGRASPDSCMQRRRARMRPAART